MGKVNIVCFIGLAFLCSNFVFVFELFFFIVIQKVNCVFWWTCLPPLQQRARGKKCHRGIEHWATVGKPENINTMERSKQLIQQPGAQTMERKHQCVKVILVIYGHNENGIIM